MATEQAKITLEMRRIEAVTQGAELADLGNVVGQEGVEGPNLRAGSHILLLELFVVSINWKLGLVFALKA